MRKASSVAASSQALPPSRSLENIYEKIKDLKCEFQHVEEKMRSAVEALNYPDKVGGVTRDDSGHCSSSSSGYYPGKIADRMMRQQEQQEQQESSSGVSTPTYPFSVSSCSSPPPSQHSRPLRHCDTYVQIPVDRGHQRSRRTVWSKEVASWKLTWERNGTKKEVIEYRATVTEYE